jgi:hypothetical protein
MTIRIERQALLRVISTSPPPLSHDPPINNNDDEDEFVVVDLPPEKKPQETATARAAANTATTNDHFEDDDSQTVISSVLSEEEDDDLEDNSSTQSSESRVSFADELITDVWTRPYTPTEDIPTLFYSSDTIAQVSTYPPFSSLWGRGVLIRVTRFLFVNLHNLYQERVGQSRPTFRFLNTRVQ